MIAQMSVHIIPIGVNVRLMVIEDGGQRTIRFWRRMPRAGREVLVVRVNLLHPESRAIALHIRISSRTNNVTFCEAFFSSGPEHPKLSLR